MAIDTNQEAYNNEAVVTKYQSQQKLQAAENTILKILMPDLAEYTVLDIGVGTGRTSIHIAPACKHYTGVDYAPNMIDYCRKKYKYENAVFEVVDARDMHQFGNGEFDLVVFSFNGIDCVSFEERDKIFGEIARVLKDGGYFVFSTHNTRNLNRKYAFRMPRNPFNYFKEKVRLQNIRKCNGSIGQFRNRDYFFLFDGVENNWAMSVLYILPEFQTKILEEKGFSKIMYFNWKTGKEITAEFLPAYTEPWLYYLSQKKLG